MSKSHVKELSLVYEALFEDAKYTFPTLVDEFEKDLTRLRCAIEQRGLPLFLVDLPALCKHLDRCLDNGEYKLSGLPLSKRASGRTPIPKFLRGLYLLVFDSSGSLKEDYNVEAILFLRQIYSCAKKVSLPCSEEAVEQEVALFLSLDVGLPEPERFWTSEGAAEQRDREEYQGFGNSPQLIARCALSYEGSNPSAADVTLLRTLDSVSRILTSTLGSYDPSEWKFRHGPGAISQIIGPTNKYCWQSWSDELESVFPLADYGYHSYSAWAGETQDRKVLPNQSSSRLISVPKTFLRPRLIAAEPSENQWCQQNVWNYLESRVQKTWISGFVRFRDQTLNQDLCKIGSERGEYATLDLSSASDLVTPHIVGQFFNRNPRLLDALRATRTRSLTQDLLSSSPGKIELRKFSTMGSACTFPIESLVFLGIAISACLYTRQLPATPKNIQSFIGEVAVFGDDIIVPSDCRESTIRLLEILYFKVNTAKSYWNGLFRESCGVDAFGGVDVTPIYWQGRLGNAPEAIASTLECSNNFYKKFFVNTSVCVATTIRRVLPYVTMASGVAGLKSFCKPAPSGKTRWNQDLQRHESRCLVFSSQTPKTKTDDDSSLHQYFTEAPSPFIQWESGYAMRPVIKYRHRWIPVQDIIAQ